MAAVLRSPTIPRLSTRLPQDPDAKPGFMIAAASRHPVDNDHADKTDNMIGGTNLMRILYCVIAATSVLWLAACAQMAASSGATKSATIRQVTSAGEGESFGTVVFRDSEYGLWIAPDFVNLQPGPHALHVHENPSCAPGSDGTPGGGAGGHYDPAGTGMHMGPYGEGHLGDLPNLIVENDGSARVPVVAPRVTVADLTGRALIIHAGADRYDGHAEHQHGTGGARMYCGLIR
jgi:Cu-Zn family superoxide dismutase